MYCKHCGSRIDNDKAEVCIKCGVKIDSLDPPNYCPNCGTTLESTDEEICHSCGNPVSSTISAIKNCGWKTGELKSVTEFIINRDSVDRKLGFFLLMMLPTIVIACILSYIFPAYNELHVFSVMNSIVQPIISMLIISFFTVAFYNFVWKAISTGRAEVSFKFNKTLYLYLILLSILNTIIDTFFNFFHGLIVSNTLSGKDVLTGLILSLIHLIIIVIIMIITLPILYLIVSRNYSLGKAIKVGIKLGFKYFWKFFILILSFIPLLLLCGITFGILLIFKGTYFYATQFVLLEKICIEENL